MMRPNIESVLAAHTPVWMRIDGVTGTAIGLLKGQQCLVVFVAHDSDRVRNQLPKSVSGYEVDVRITGTFRAHEST